MWGGSLGRALGDIQHRRSGFRPGRRGLNVDRPPTEFARRLYILCFVPRAKDSPGIKYVARGGIRGQTLSVRRGDCLMCHAQRTKIDHLRVQPTSTHPPYLLLPQRTHHVKTRFLPALRPQASSFTHLQPQNSLASRPFCLGCQWPLLP